MEWAFTTSALHREPSELSQAQGLQLIELTKGGRKYFDVLFTELPSTMDSTGNLRFLR